MLLYKTDVIRRINVNPRYVGRPDIKEIVKKLTKQDVKENSFTPEVGYVICIVCICDIGKGKFMPLTGMVEFTVKFEALVLFPFIGEVIDADVVKVTETSIIFRHICMYGVVRTYLLNDPADFEFRPVDDDHSGNLEVIGNPAKEPLVTSRDSKTGELVSKSDPEKVIRPGSVIRLRITQRTLGGTGFFIVGSMSGEFLGLTKNPPPVPIAETTLMALGSDDTVPLEDLHNQCNGNPESAGPRPCSPNPDMVD